MQISLLNLCFIHLLYSVCPHNTCLDKAKAKCQTLAQDHPQPPPSPEAAAEECLKHFGALLPSSVSLTGSGQQALAAIKAQLAQLALDANKEADNLRQQAQAQASTKTEEEATAATSKDTKEESSPAPAKTGSEAMAVDLEVQDYIQNLQKELAKRPEESDEDWQARKRARLAGN